MIKKIIPFDCVFGNGTYDNLTTFKVVNDADAFSIVPPPVPASMLIWTNIFFIVSIGAAVIAVGKLLPRSYAPLAFACVGIFTCSGFTAYVVARSYVERRRGPWMILRKSSGYVELPRQRLSFAVSSVKYIQVITALSFRETGTQVPVTEVNVVVEGEGGERRYPMLCAISVNAFDEIIRSLRQHTSLPIKRMT